MSEVTLRRKTQMHKTIHVLKLLFFKNVFGPMKYGCVPAVQEYNS